MEWLLAKNLSAEGAKQDSPGHKPREKRDRETSAERAAQIFSLLNDLCRPFRAAALSIPYPGFRPLRSLHPGLCCLALSALFPYAASTLGFAVSRFQRYSHTQPPPWALLSRAFGAIPIRSQ
jgi:hypothetical protein